MPLVTHNDDMNTVDAPADNEKLGHPFHPELMSNERELYSVPRTPQRSALSAAMRRHAPEIVSLLYEGLERLPPSKRILEILTGPEIEHFRFRQVQQLCMLTDPDLTAANHRATALKMGRTRAILGLNREDLVRARGILSEAVFRRIDTKEHGEALGLLKRRMNHDLAWQAEAYQQLQVSRQAVLQHITQLAWKTESYSDLISEVVQTLSRHQAVAGCSVSRPDNKGILRFESAAGSTIERYLAAIDAAAPIMTDNPFRSQGPTERAWNGGKVARSVNIATDPRMAPWRAAALQAGFHSSVVIPLCQPDGPTAAVLNLYSPFPGGFSGADQIAFISLLQTIISFAIARIERLAGNTRGRRCPRDGGADRGLMALRPASGRLPAKSRRSGSPSTSNS